MKPRETLESLSLSCASEESRFFFVFSNNRIKTPLWREEWCGLGALDSDDLPVSQKHVVGGGLPSIRSLYISRDRLLKESQRVYCEAYVSHLYLTRHRRR